MASPADRGDRVLAWRASSAERELAFGALMGLLDADLGDALDGLAGRPRGGRSRWRWAGSRPGGRAPSRAWSAWPSLDLCASCPPTSRSLVALDDAQWCDPASADALAFAARRLRSEPVAFVLAVRTGTPRVRRRRPSSGALRRGSPRADPGRTR